MADGEGKVGDLYSVLGLDKACSNMELRSAYKKLAMRWHPDRCQVSGKSTAEEAKSKFQEIQEAYSVLSDSNKRLLYDVGVYPSDDDDHEMGDFLDEMAEMMSNTAPCSGTPQESFRELQGLFMEMFEKDLCVGRNGLKRDCEDMSTGRPRSNDAAAELSELFDSPANVFCFGSTSSSGSSRIHKNGKRREVRKQRASSRQGTPSAGSCAFR